MATQYVYVCKKCGMQIGPVEKKPSDAGCPKSGSHQWTGTKIN